jgi:undecaprenyl diphosphate synthase
MSAAVIRHHATGAQAACPAHVAIIMDGNGRWAASRHLPKIAGHREGARAVRRTIEAAIEHGVGWLTLYAFSSENWRRPAGEVIDLTGLLRQYLKSEIAELKENGVRLRVIGDLARFDTDIQRDLASAEAATAANARLNLTVALSYGARAEIAAAARKLAEAVREGRLEPAQIDEAQVAGALTTTGIPDPDLIIRTSGEQRLSGFLMWQSAHSEFYFCEALWPDFRKVDFIRALRSYGQRERRFGR